jgi:hypothetical protein
VNLLLLGLQRQRSSELSFDHGSSTETQFKNERWVVQRASAIRKKRLSTAMKVYHSRTTLKKCNMSNQKIVNGSRFCDENWQVNERALEAMRGAEGCATWKVDVGTSRRGYCGRVSA